MKQVEYHFPSKTGVCEIFARKYLPDNGQTDTVLVIHHGMAEHQERYRGFIEYLCDQGMTVYMHDMANHGKSNTDYALTGWFGEKDGYKGLVEDFRENVLRAKTEYPGKQIIVMGHSMGSFICRLYTARYSEDGFDGAIFMGTGGPSPAAAAGRTVASLISAIRGKRYKSKLMDRLAFGTYNRTFEGRTPFDWLTRDQEIVDQYIADRYCGFLFTIQGMRDLVDVNTQSNTDAWFEAVPKSLPILLISGAQDPVGDYGKGIKMVGEKLASTGHTRVTTTLYEDDRHEVLNELNRTEVMEDIVTWIRTI